MPTETAPIIETPAAGTVPINPDLPIAAPGEQLRGNTAEDIQTTDVALDALLKEASAESEGEPTAEEIAAQEAKDAKDKADKEAAEKAAAEAKAKETPGDKPAEKPAEKPAAPVVDDFDKVTLPPYTKPASVTAFATVKQMAREQIATIAREKAELQAKFEAAEKARAEAGSGIAPEVEKELKELRDFRLKFDVEADPSFQSYDKTVSENHDLILARMRASGVDEASVKRIQEIGVGHVEWEDVLPKLPANLKRFIEGKLYENDNLVEKKKLAIETAKSNASEFVRTRQEELYKGNEGRQKTTMAEFNALLPNMDWLKKETIDPKADAAVKAKAEETNKLVDKVTTDLQEAINDDSPRMRAVLIGGFAKLIRLQYDFENTKAAHKAEVEKLNATVAEKDAFIARIKKSSTSRLSSAAPGIGETKTKSKTDVTESPSEALDRHYREAVAAQEK